VEEMTKWQLSSGASRSGSSTSGLD